MTVDPLPTRRATSCSCTRPSATTRSRTTRPTSRPGRSAPASTAGRSRPGGSPSCQPSGASRRSRDCPWSRLGDRVLGRRPDPRRAAAAGERAQPPGSRSPRGPARHAGRARAEVRLPAARRQGDRRVRGGRLRAAPDVGRATAGRGRTPWRSASSSTACGARGGDGGRPRAPARPRPPCPTSRSRSSTATATRRSRPRASARPPSWPPGWRPRARPTAVRDAAGAHPADRGTARSRAWPGAGRRPRPPRGAPGRVGGRRVPHPRGPPRPGRAAGAHRGALGRAAGGEAMDAFARAWRTGWTRSWPPSRRWEVSRAVAVVHGGAIGELRRQATASRPFAFVHAENTSRPGSCPPGGGRLLRSFNDRPTSRRAARGERATPPA